jgi:hypothetical protein
MRRYGRYTILLRDNIHALRNQSTAVYDWGEPQRFKFCLIFRGEMGFVYQLARTIFLFSTNFFLSPKRLINQFFK